MSLRSSCALLTLACAVVATNVRAAPMLPSDDATLEGLRVGYERLEREFATRENGLHLDPILLPEEVASVEAFFAQTEIGDFQTFSGKHPFEVLSSYDEHGDEGNFAGVASVGIAARLIVLRASGAPEDQVAWARDAAVRAARAWVAYGAIGGEGVVARGVRRVAPLVDGDPSPPGPPPELVPLADGGSPLPADKVAVWRAPVAPGFDGWIWFDDTSKDQVSGYALAVAWLWDALRDDPLVDAQLVDDLAEGLTAFAYSLMEVAPETGVDLCIRDADGRLTKHYDLNPRVVNPEADALPETSPFRNGFNALLALGVVRAAYHVSGDPVIGEYYYEELVGRRKMSFDPTQTLGLMYLGERTNYSNVNMAAIGLATLGRFETDPHVRDDLEATLATQFWDTGSNRDASSVEQGWFDAVYGAYSPAAPDAIRARMLANLGGFPPAPCIERERINCDEAELAAYACVGLDGTTMITILGDVGHSGQPVAQDIVPMSIRPDSDFMWRSDPHNVNGGGNTKVDPRGDWLAAYWLGRIAELGDPDANISPNARPPLPYTLGEGGSGGGGEGGQDAQGGAGGGASSDDETSEGCSCGVPSTRSERGWLAGVALAIAWSSRRRRRHD